MPASMFAPRLLLVAILLAAACGPEEVAQNMDVTAGYERAVAPPPAPPAPDRQALAVARGATAFSGEESQPATSAEAARQLVRTGRMALRVDAVEPAVDSLARLAARLGGWVGDVSVHTGDQAVRHASVHLRVPADRLDDAVAAIRPLGTVESVNVSTQDVTDQHADLQARLTNARRLEERLLTLLQTRTGDLQQVLAAERELSRVRTEIERYETTLRQLDDRIAMSSLTVQLREPRAVLGGSAGPSVLGDAFRRAGANFLRTVARMIAFGGAIAPVILLLALVLTPALVWWRRRGGRRPRPPRADPSSY